MKPLEETVPCPRCEGAGELMNPAYVGKMMRSKRKVKGLTLSMIAAKMGITKGYLSDLELGWRGWNDGLIEQYEKALKK